MTHKIWDKCLRLYNDTLFAKTYSNSPMNLDGVRAIKS